jgi:hypothetical protein
MIAVVPPKLLTRMYAKISPSPKPTMLVTFCPMLLFSSYPEKRRVGITPVCQEQAHDEDYDNHRGDVWRGTCERQQSHSPDKPQNGRMPVCSHYAPPCVNGLTKMPLRKPLTFGDRNISMPSSTSKSTNTRHWPPLMIVFLSRVLRIAAKRQRYSQWQTLHTKSA